MAREIKFRAWDEEEKKMHYSDSKLDYGIWFSLDRGKVECLRNCAYTDSFGDEHDDWQPLDNIMEYTGLKDECGKEIYEGDICKNIVDNHILKVTYWETDGSYMFEDQNENGNGYNLYEFGEVEVIGNIFENPELLEVVS